MNTLVKNNAQVDVVELPTIKGDKLLYVTVTTKHGSVPISIGEKNFKNLKEILKEDVTNLQFEKPVQK